jgi:hypothetical protein
MRIVGQALKPQARGGWDSDWKDDRFFWLLPEPEQEVYGSGPRSEDVFGFSEFFGVQRRRFTCPIVLKNLIGLSGKSRPGPRVSNDFVPAPIISVKEHDFYIHGSGFWRWLRQFDLPVFILTFEYLHQKKFYTIASGSSISPVRLDFRACISGHRRVKQGWMIKAIAYYLKQRDKVDAYLQAGRDGAEKLQQELNGRHRDFLTKLRQQLLSSRQSPTPSWAGSSIFSTKTSTGESCAECAEEYLISTPGLYRK